jgi:predicted sugar kinase
MYNNTYITVKEQNMDPKNKNIEKLLEQMSRAGVLQKITDMEQKEAEQVLRMILADMPPSLVEELLLAATEDQLQLTVTDNTDIEAIAQQETDALFDRLGVGR